MRTKPLLTVTTLVVAVLFLIATQAADNGTVSGTIVAKGLRTSADIVVSLQAPGLKLAAPAQPVEMDQKGMLFLPHALPVVTGTTVRFLNSDPTPHNVFSPEGKFNLGTWPQGEARDFTFDTPGVYSQLCKVHPEMIGYVVVLDTPYFAVTDRAGRYAIRDVPPGTYTLVAWSEKLKEGERSVVVESGATVTVDLTLSR